jgi:hypothetical protein
MPATPNSMGLVLHGFTAAEGWITTDTSLPTDPAHILLYPIFDERERPCLLVIVIRNNKVPSFARYSYHDTLNAIWQGTALQKRQTLYNLVMNAADNLPVDWKVVVGLRDNGYGNCEGLLLSSLQYECSELQHGCLVGISEVTVLLPTRSVDINMHHAHAALLLDSMKWSADFAGVVFRNYNSTYHVIPPLVLKLYKQLRNMQYTFEFTPYLGMSADDPRHTQVHMQMVHDMREVKKMFEDMPMCNSLQFVQQIADGSVHCLDVYSKSEFMAGILIQAEKPQNVDEKSQLSDLPMELLKKIYFA